jgi:hypothetical protein
VYKDATFRVDVSKYPAGIYLYKLSAKGHLLDVGKITISK